MQSDLSSLILLRIAGITVLSHHFENMRIKEKIKRSPTINTDSDQRVIILSVSFSPK